MATFTRCCPECGITFTSTKRWAEFCQTSCRKEFNNRRALRGSEVYDILMNWRFGSGQGRDNDARNILCELAAAYHESDKRKRSGRRSYTTTAKALDQIGRLSGVPDGR